MAGSGKKRVVPVRREVELSADVAAVLGDDERREKRRKMSPGERRRAKADELRVRIWGEVTRCPWLRDEVEAIAEREGVPTGGLVPWLIAVGVRAYRKGERPDKVRTDSPRYEYIVEVSEEDAGL